MSTNATGRVLPISLLRAKPALAPHLADAAELPFNDDDLIERLRNGDERAALILFHRYNKVAFSVGYRVLQDEGEAEDLVQEIFLRLCSEADSFDAAKGSARTWIIQLIYRRAFDRRSYLQRRQFYGGTESEERTNTVGVCISPEDSMIARLTVEQLQAVFNDLTDRQRETLELFFFKGMKLAEIAERFGEDVKNVRHHYYRGLERLRQLAGKTMRSRKFR